MLTVEGCRSRQKRLLEVLQKQGLDGALITNREHVYYFTAYRTHFNQTPAAFLEASGKLTLIGFKMADSGLACDAKVDYPAKATSTMAMDQANRCGETLAKVLPKGKKLGVDLDGPGAMGRAAGPEATDITRAVQHLRKRKDPDELAILRRAIAVTHAMYTYAKNNIKPGLDEMEFFAEIRAAATRAANQDCERFGNDYRCNARGGSARRRPMQAGELYILDAGPSLDGYHADNCRTFAVDRKGTDVQHKACRKIIECLGYMETRIRPGVTGKQMFEDAKAFLKDAGHSGLVHHLGHGIGLQPHESPELNPDYSAVLEVGDVFTMEPGLYSDELNAGIRLEQDYVITENGWERLTSFPLDLA